MTRLLALALLFIAVVSCNSSDGATRTSLSSVVDPSVQGDDSGAIAVQPDPERTTLVVTSWKGADEADSSGIPEVIASFEEKYPTIDVSLRLVTRLDSDVVLVQEIQDGNPPDVMMSDLALTKLLADQQLLLDLGTDSAWYGRISDDLRSSLTFDGAVFMAPMKSEGMGNFVNLDLLQQVGITEAPTTIDELIEACVRLTAAGIKPMTFAGGFSAPLFVIANGLADTTQSPEMFGSGMARFADDAGFLQGIESVRSLINAQCFEPAEQASLDPWSVALTTFRLGEVAMMPHGGWNIPGYDLEPDLTYVVAPIPTRNEPGVVLDLLGFGWSVPSGGENAEAARAFVDWMARPPQVQTVVEADTGYTPFDDATRSFSTSMAPLWDSRSAHGSIDYPFGVLQWPKPLENEIWSSMGDFLLDPSLLTNEEVLNRWDEAVAEALGSP